jgi:hypothetical protein
MSDYIGGKEMSSREAEALGRFAADVRGHYGKHLLGVYLFGRRPIDDEEEEAGDVEVAVVLADGDWQFLDEKKQLVRLTFDILVDTDLYIRAWPLPASAWRDPSTYRDPAFIQEIKRHAEPIMAAA